MIYKEYGKTGKKISAVSFGGMRFDTSKSQEENAAVVKYAFDKGINYFDTAPGYCDGQSEKIFGLAFKDMPREQFYVGTKAMPVYVDTAQKAKDAVKKSLEIMNLKKIDFYYVWCLRKMEHYELAMKSGGQYEGLLQCKEEGLIDHIVFSSHQPGDEIKKIVEQDQFDGVLFGINILNFPYRWDGVTAAYKGGYGVAVMNPLAGGAIPSHEKQLSFLSSKKGETPTEAALRFAISSPEITTCLNGITTKKQIDMACEVAENSTQFTYEDIRRIKSKLGKNMNEACTACGYCNDCPKNIPIPSYLQIYNEKQVFNADDEMMKNRLKVELDWGMLVMRKAAASECIECKKCEKACTQHIPIIKRLKEFIEWEKAIEENIE